MARGRDDKATSARDYTKGTTVHSIEVDANGFPVRSIERDADGQLWYVAKDADPEPIDADKVQAYVEKGAEK